VAGALGVVVTAGSASAASAALVGNEWVNGRYEGCLQDNGATVSLAGCDDSTRQQWVGDALKGEPGDEGTVYEMRNVGTGQCLTADGTGPVVMAACSKDVSQGWTEESILQNQATDLCVVAESTTDMQQAACDPHYQHDDQRWYVSQVGP
jgi:hypothetical protein